jgi:uncharacterized membrane protein required for colicin V production
LLFGGIAGFQKGLITGLARFAGKITAIAVAVIFHKQFLNAVDPLLGVRRMVEPQIAAFLAKVIEKKASAGGPFNSHSVLQPVINDATIALTDYILKIGSLLLLFILVTIIINIIIALVINPLAKSLGFVNRGGGLVFGILGVVVGVCLVIGLLSPFLTTISPGVLKINNSLIYPWIMDGYKMLSGIISAFAGDFLVNPLETLPMFKETII